MSGVVRVCFVCLGNICRSPAAEAVLRQLVDEAGLSGVVVEVDSAGTSRYHLGDQPDHRTRAEAARRGVAIEHRARQLTGAELGRWDFVIGMDRQNLRDLRAMTPAGGQHERLHLLRSFDPDADSEDVPDPYYGGDEEFRLMFDLIEPACRALLGHLQARSSEDGKAVRR